MQSHTPRIDLTNAILTSGLAIAGTTLATALIGRSETGSYASALNATSHILWGDEAARQDKLDVKHTVAGAVLNAGAMIAWAGVQEVLFGRGARGSIAKGIAAGAVTSALAYVTDYYIVPERLTPGFEKRLSPGAMAAIYGVLAATLGAGLALGRRAR